MQFAVRTLAPDMSIARQIVDAPDADAARRQVEARGLFVSAVEPLAAGLRAGRGRGLSLVLFSQELLALLTAGLGIVESLEALLEKEANPVTRGVLERLLAGLREGKRFSGVLAEQADASVAGAERDQLLAQHAHAHRQAIGRGQLLGEQHRHPEAAQQRAHRRAGARFGKQVVVGAAQHEPVTIDASGETSLCLFRPGAST